MTAKNNSLYYELLSKEEARLAVGNSVSEIHNALKEIHRIIKKHSCQVIHPSFLEKDEQKIIHSLLRSLILILIGDDCVADVMLLCGSCISLLVATMFNPEFSSFFLIYLYSHFDKFYSGTKKISQKSREASKKEITNYLNSLILINSSHNPVCFKLKEYLIEDINSNLKSPSFQQIAILNGIVSCRMPNLFCFKLNSCHSNSFLILIFNAIHLCCLSPSVHQYHAFTVLLNWMRMCEFCIPALSETKDVFFSTNGNVVQKVLCLLESNWQSPIKGINGIVKEMYRLLITLSKLESKRTGSYDMQLVEYLLKKSMLLSWQTKGKYLMLSVLLQNINYSKFFEKYPEAPLRMIFSLKANYIASSVAEVYKMIVTNMKNSNSEEEFCSEWCNWWRKPIMDSLCCNDKLLIQNVTNNILPWTMKHCPKSYDLMMNVENLSEEDSIQLLLLRVAKESIPRPLSEKELLLINKNLHHGSIQIRTEIISILCSSPKKSESLRSKELDFVKSIILENLNIDSAPFHHHLLSQLRILLTRIRDSLAQEYRTHIRNNDCISDFSQLEFVDWLAHFAIKNTFPGACYQRRRVSLHILKVIFDVYIQSPMGLKRKERPSKSVEQVIEWAQRNNLWLFFTNDVLTYIVPCITDFTDEIRVVSADLLLQHSSWPTIMNCNKFEEPVLKLALSLCNHPDYRNNDGGARICCIILKRLSGDLQEKECSQSLGFLKYLVSTSKEQLTYAEEDFMTAALYKPIHGTLLAIQYCLSHSQIFMKSSFQFQEKETLEVLKEIINLCFDTIHYMLKIMKGNDENFNCPSFLDIGKALEKLVISKKKISSNATVGNQNIDDIKFQEDENSDFNSLCDLLLSCCWHCIKNSCYLLCEVSAIVSSLNIDFNEKKLILQEISQKFSSILITCRHRGVVEACCEALKTFCACLQKDKAIYEDITMELLKLVFETLEDTTKVSVTRRSAGLPLLFQAVVSSEENNINRKLLSFTIDNLINLINKPLPSKESISEKTDLPQAHSYHILKALVLDASLSQSILPYFNIIIPVCVSGFSSSMWAIRNGALQLFGVILPRVCGQKKVRDDDSEHNMVSAFELFSRCPSLKIYLLHELKKCVRFHDENQLCSELVPVLSLLVKLVPELKEQREFMVDFTPLLSALLDIPVWKVRDLATTALSSILSPAEIFKLLEDIVDLLKGSHVNLNKIHSILFIVQKFLKRNLDNLPTTLFIENCLMNLYSLMEETIKCPLLLGMVIDMMLSIEHVKKNESTFKCMKECKILSQNQGIGLAFYESKIVLAQLKLCPSADLPSTFKRFSSRNKDIQIVCLQFLSEKLSSEKATDFFYTKSNLKYWKEIFVSIIDYISLEKHPSVIKEALEFMIDLCSDWNVGKEILGSDTALEHSVTEHLQCLLDMQSGLSVSALSFTMWSIHIKLIIEQPDQSPGLEKWDLLFNTYCQPRSTDILRMQAARSIAILGPLLAEYLANNIGTGKDSFAFSLIGLCEGSLLLLQDEDQDVRNEACKFPSQIQHSFSVNTVQFNVGIKVVFEYMLKVLHSQQCFLLYLWNRLQNYPSTVKILQSYSKVKKVNLFEQEYVNVFSEPHQLLIHYQSNLKAVFQYLSKANYDLYYEEIKMFLLDMKTELHDVHSVLSCIDTEIFNQNFTYHHLAFLALKKLRCQVEVLSKQSCIIMVDDPLSDELIELDAKWSSIEKLLPSITCWFLNQL